MDTELRALAPFLDQSGHLSAFPAKNKKKRMALWYLSQKIQAGRNYTEAEMNDLLDEYTTFHDPATLRRELYNKHLLNRTADSILPAELFGNRCCIPAENVLQYRKIQI